MDDTHQDSPSSGPIKPPSRSFRESSIAFAVDTSGSTEGHALGVEKEAIRQIASLLPPDRQSNIKVLPWNDRCEPLVRLDGLDTLRSDGGTDPAVLFDTPQNRMVLSEAHFWFLMTDGLIYPQEVRNFASKLTRHGMHGKACVITIVGYKFTLPGQCNISVGLSVFATSPHVAVLFQDLASNQVHILGVKGCFTELLRPGESSPKLDNSTRWEDVPRTSFENLTRVTVPPPQAVGQGEIILEGGLVNLDDLFGQTEVPDEFLGKILDNPNNQHTLSLAAKSMGKTQELNTWLDRVEQKIDMMEVDCDIDPPVELEQEGSQAPVDQIIADLMSQNVDAKTKTEAQRRLSSANEFWENSRNSADAQRVSESSVHHHRRSSTGAMRRTSQSGFDTAQNNLTYTVYPIRTQPDYTRKLINPGFAHPGKNGDCVRGICMLCAKPDVLLCLHLVKPPTSLRTQGLPEPNSNSRLRYPLAMGNFPETDIISSFVSCDPCAARLLKKPGKTAYGEKIVANLPLVVCDGTNRDAWLETLRLATERRFAADDLPAVFLSILATKVERSPNEQNRKSLLRYIMDWCCSMLLREGHASVFNSEEDDEEDEDDKFEISNKRTLYTGSLPQRPAASWASLKSGLRRGFGAATVPTRKPNLLLTYPLDGFVVANVVLSNSMLKTAISHDGRRTIVWARFLYRLVETYHEFRTREAGSLVDTATSLLLLQDQSLSSDRSNLFRLENMRLLTIHKERSKPSPDDPTGSSESQRSTAEFFRSIGALLTTRSQRFRLTFRPSGSDDVSLVGTPFLDREDLADFERLGPLFSWIADEAGHALAFFLNWLLRVNSVGRDGDVDDKGASGDGGNKKWKRFESPQERFSWLRRHPQLKLVFQDPRAVSPKCVEENIKDLPSLRH